MDILFGFLLFWLAGTAFITWSVHYAFSKLTDEQKESMPLPKLTPFREFCFIFTIWPVMAWHGIRIYMFNKVGE